MQPNPNGQCGILSTPQCNKDSQYWNDAGDTDFYFNLVLFIFASQLYFYDLGPSSLLGY